MHFGFNLNSGGFVPRVKYDARAGRVFCDDRDEETGERTPVDVTDGFEFLPDFPHAEKGYAWFQSGQAPDFVMVPIDAKDLPPKPSENHRPAVRLPLMISSKAAGDGGRLRELTVTASTAIHGLWTLYEQWIANREHNPGKTPLVKLMGVKPVATGGGGQRSINFEPQFAIVKWVNTPQEFETAPQRSATAPNGSAAADAHTAAKGGAKPPVAPAKASTAADPAADEESDWG